MNVSVGRRYCLFLNKCLTRQLDTYSQLVRFLAKAREVMANKHGYAETANLLWAIHRYHVDALHFADAETLRDGLVRRLRFHDSRFAFAMIWVCMKPSIYCPDFGVSFQKWNYPHIDLEFDYGGAFAKSINGWVYDGGETKFSLSCNASSHPSLPAKNNANETSRRRRISTTRTTNQISRLYPLHWIRVPMRLCCHCLRADHGRL
jgi:hypothetical protein